MVGRHEQRVLFEELLETLLRRLGVPTIALDVGLENREVVLTGFENDEAVHDGKRLGEVPRLDLDLHQGAEGRGVNRVRLQVVIQGLLSPPWGWLQNCRRPERAQEASRTGQHG